jgi:hypothetical protein
MLIEERILSAKKSGRSVVDDGDIGLVVRYKGSEASATVEVAALPEISPLSTVL